MNHTQLKFLAVITLFVSIFLFQGIAYAQITLGQSCAMSGQASFLGMEMNRGAASYFSKYADNVVLNVLDDKYEPDKCVENTRKFLDENVTALFGYVGTPTSKVAISLAKEKNMLFFGAFTGAGFLSDHNTNPYAFSLRASYDAEIEAMVKHLKEDLGISKIALFVQRDAFGMAGVTGAVKAVKKIGNVEIIPAVPEIPNDAAPKEIWDKFWNFIPNYQRNTVAVGRSARQIMGNRVQAVIMVGAYRPCAAAINLWKQLEFDAVFINISFVGTRALAEACKNNLKNVLVTQVVPNPWDATIPVVKEYQEVIGDGNYGFVSLEGYIAAKTLHKAIKDAGASINSDSLKRALESMSAYDVGGLNVSFGTSDHRGLDSIWLTKIEAVPNADGKFDYKFIYVDKIVKE